jgi:ABC-2 type transport system permease protein
MRRGARWAGDSARYPSAVDSVLAPSGAHSRTRTLRHYARTLHVIAGAEFKLKYSGSALGYIWSLVKPLMLFTMLYLVFGRVFKLGSISHYYPVSLLLGIVLITFFNDATILGMNSFVARESLLRKMSFPRLIIPAAATLTAAITLVVNFLAVIVFIAWNRLVPQLTWLLLVPLLLELYVFALAVAVILATIFVRLRDMGQVWELLLQVFFYASPVIYPIGYLPPWARTLAFVNPFTQILQDVRSIVLYPDQPANKITAPIAFGFEGARIIPLAVVALLAVFALALYRREEPYIAERV